MPATAANQSFQLPADHPGFSDPGYRIRRAEIAASGDAHVPGGPIEDVVYTPEEDGVWRTVSTALAAEHERYACAEYRRSVQRLALPADRVPQLREVDDAVRRLTGFRIEPVPGLVPIRRFYGALADRTFLATQYIRHHSVPYYTPEPDIVHEIIGHANMLASPAFADVYQAAGEATRRARDDDELQFLSRVFWFTLEFGVVWEDGDLRAYGAGLLSSFGELDHFRSAEVRQFDVAEMGTADYDITAYQPVLYAAADSAHLVDDLTEFFEGFAR